MKFLPTVLLLFGFSKLLVAQGVAVPNKQIVVDQEQFKDVAGDLRCPTCTGLSVLDSEASFSIQIKNEVKEQLASGKDKETILKFFTDRYGPWILRSPPKQGVHAWAWIVPIAALILGPLVILYFVWMRRRNDGDDEDVSRPIEAIVAEMNQRLDGLRSLKGGHQ